MNKIIKLFKGNAGFSMIQAMMMAGVIGAMATVTVNIIQQQQEAQKKQDDLSKSRIVTRQIRDLLRDPLRCAHFLGDTAPSSLALHLADADANGTVETDEGQDVHMDRVISSESPAAQQNYTTANVLFKPSASGTGGGETIYSGLQIINFRTGATDPVQAGRLALWVYFSPERASDYIAGRDMNVSGEFELEVTLDGSGNVTGCVAN